MHESIRNRLPQGKQSQLQSLDEQGQSQYNACQPQGHAGQVGERLPDHDDLEKGDDDDDGRQVAQRIREPPQDC